MLTITVPKQDLFDERTGRFFQTEEYQLVLEHSLVSMSKWESKWKKPFLTKEKKSFEEEIDYIRAMTITQNVSPEVYKLINQPIIDQVLEYIEDPMTATTFREEPEKESKERITAEIVYYWMVTFQIPFECQKWHLNRLLALIRVCNIKNQPAKKMNPKQAMADRRKRNQEMRAKLGSKG